MACQPRLGLFLAAAETFSAVHGASGCALVRAVSPLTLNCGFNNETARLR